MSKAVERHLRTSAESIIMANNNADSAKFDCACAIRYPKDVKKRFLQENLRSRHILPCFGEAGALGNWVVHVDAKPTVDLDDSALRRMKDLWSKPPWMLAYEGAGAAAVGRAASGLHTPLTFCSNLALISLRSLSLMVYFALSAGRARKSASASNDAKQTAGSATPQPAAASAAPPPTASPPATLGTPTCAPAASGPARAVQQSGCPPRPTSARSAAAVAVADDVGFLAAAARPAPVRPGPGPAPVAVPSHILPAARTGLPRSGGIPGAPIRAATSMAVQLPMSGTTPQFPPVATFRRFLPHPGPIPGPVPSTFPPFLPAPHTSLSPAPGISAGNVVAAAQPAEATSPAPPIRPAAPRCPTAVGLLSGCPAVVGLPGSAAVGSHGAGGIPGAPRRAATSMAAPLTPTPTRSAVALAAVGVSCPPIMILH